MIYGAVLQKNKSQVSQTPRAGLSHRNLTFKGDMEDSVPLLYSTCRAPTGARCCIKPFTFLSLNPHNDPNVLLLSPIYRWENGGSEKLRELVLSVRAVIQTRASDPGVYTLNPSAILPPHWRCLPRSACTFNPSVVFIFQIPFETDRARATHVMKTLDLHDFIESQN